MLYIHFGLRRSGNHAFLGWLYPMLGKYVHINNLVLNRMTGESFVKFRGIEFTKDYIDRQWLGFANIDDLIISLEDKTFVQVKKFIDDIKNKGNLKDDNIKLTVIIRNPYNHLASVHKCIRLNANQMKNLVKQYLKQLLRIENIFGRELIPVFYDRWMTDKNYRKTLANRLGLTFDDANHDKVIGWAKSSFDKTITTVDDKVIEDLTSRYKIYEDDPFFKKNILDDKELELLWKQIKTKFKLNL